ncbi:hypothetical protein ACVOMV_32910 [Mesorhizobium atlanticum]
MMPTEAANSSVWGGVMVLPPVCGGRSINSALAIRALSVPFMGVASLSACFAGTLLATIIMLQLK